MIPTTHGDLTPNGIIYDLTYTSYAHNRRIAPHITPERWRKVYGPAVDEMEERFQRDSSNGK